MSNYFWQNKPWQAFKNFAIIFSFIVNIVLVLVLLLAAPLIIPIVSEIAHPIVGGLTESFVEMGEANIVQTINVEDEIPISFNLPLNQQTTVVLSEPVPLDVQAVVTLAGGGGTIFGNVALTLPEGTELPVQLTLDVPVDQTIPINLPVDVNIPLDETELGQPFNRLQALFSPLNDLLGGLPASNEELGDRILGPAPEPDGMVDADQ
ncbi:MAG: hypothetical protein QNJ45_21045 [Ardenticatenaceae bacterium]|nr:hypothetical protein [Ardenticatenaceae bacterium]